MSSECYSCACISAHEGSDDSVTVNVQMGELKLVM